MGEGSGVTSIMPIFWLAALILSALCGLYGGRFAAKLAYPSAAGLLAAAAPLPARFQFAAFAVVLFIVAVTSFIKKLLTKNS